MPSKRPPPKPSRAPSSSKSAMRLTQLGPFQLPPVPKAPGPKFHSEPPTKQKNVTASVYQSLISVFDSMSPAQRMEFVDVASTYAALDAPGRRAFMQLLQTYGALTAADRAALHDLAEKLLLKGDKP